MTVEAPGQDASKGNESFDGLKLMISKDMERLKQLRASCSETKNQNQERVLEKMVASYEEAIAILNKFTSKEQDQGDLVSSRRPDDAENPSMAASGCTVPQKDSGVNSKFYRRLRRREHIRKEIVSLCHGHDLIDDGYRWRKYGQKQNLGSKYPRFYYRCGMGVARCREKYTGCKAVKLVQRSDEDPMLYQVSYIGNHTCQRSPVDASNTRQKSLVTSDAWEKSSEACSPMDMDILDWDILDWNLSLSDGLEDSLSSGT